MVRKLTPVGRLRRLLVTGSCLLLATGCQRVPAEIASTDPEPIRTPATAPVEIEAPLTPKPSSDPTVADLPDTIDDFDRFLGFRRGDTLETVKAKLGEAPYSDVGSASGLDTYYYGVVEDTDPSDGPPNAGDDFLLVVTTVAATGWIFNLQCMVGDYAMLGIVDPRLDFLTMHLDAIRSRFGDPNSESSGFNLYESRTDPLGLDVEFVCYEHDEFVCTELWVTWYDE